MFLLIVSILLLALYYFYLKPLWNWRRSNIPFEIPVPFLGHMAKATLKRKHITEVMNELYKKHSNSRFFGFLNFKDPILVIKDPDLIKKITVKDFEAFPIHRAFADNGVDPLWSRNLFAIQDVNRWRKLRATLSPSYSTNKLRLMFSLMQECAKNFTNYYLDQIDNEIEIDIKESFRRYTNDVIASTAFGITCDSLKDQDNLFFEMGKEVSNFRGTRSLAFFLGTFCPKLMKAFGIGLFSRKVSNYFRHLVSQNIRLREEKNIIRPDMISLLLEARKGKMQQDKTEFKNEASTEKDFQLTTTISDEDITAQAMVFFLAGFEPTASLMSFVIAELVANPHVQDKLVNEIEKVYENCEGDPKFEDFKRLKYLDMVITETLRKWTLSAFLDREAIKPYTICNDDGKPVLTLKKGDNVWIPASAIHMDPTFYPNPEKFDPERFSDERKQEINQFVYLPFGTGPRNCIGYRFALMEAKTALFYVILNFEFFPSESTVTPLRLDRTQIRLQLDGGFVFNMKKRKNIKSD